MRSKSEPVRAWIGLGSNLGDRHAHLTRAAGMLCRTQGVSAVFASPVYRCAAHTLPGQPPQPDFLNAVCAADVTLGPLELLAALHDVERALGRDRSAARWSARPVDLDVIRLGERRVATDRLTLPHPRLSERAFWLRPMLDLEPLLGAGEAPVLRALLGSAPDPTLVRTDLTLPACP